VSLQSGESFKVTEQDTSPQALQRAYQPVFAWFRQRHPQWAARPEAPDAGGDAAASARLPSVPWLQGNVARGQALFRERGCRLCHTGPCAIGPDLAGLAHRRPATEVFESILQPDRAVSAGHRAETFQLRDGQAHTGRVVDESAEGLLVLVGAGRTLTLKTADLVSRRPAKGSLMPTGLLDGLQAQDLADLYAFLRTLGLPKP
jgi:putative heme-binding domain-containing protein